MDFQATLERLQQLFATCPDPGRRERPEGWCVQEVLGHLVDSASNNLQRLQRRIPGGELAFPGYDQDAFVRRAGYARFPYADLLALWSLQNRLLLHVYAAIPEEERDDLIRVGDRPATTIRSLLHDYFAHMEKHEAQVLRILTRP